MTVAAGEQLREARELKGLTVEDMAARLKVPARYIRALEAGALGDLPEPTFVRGYVKAYARALGLDAEPLVAQLAPVEVKAPTLLVGVEGGPARKGTTARAPNFRAGSSRRRFGWLIAGCALLAVLVVAVLVLLPGPQTETAVSAIPAAGSSVALPAPAAAAAATPAPNVAAPVTAPAPLPAAAGRQLTMEVNLPLPAPAAPVAAPATAATAAPAPGAAVALPPPAPTAAGATSAAQRPAVAAPAAAAPATPAAAAENDESVLKSGLFMRFRGSSWVEVRDADNVVLHTSVQAANTVLSLDGKAPLSVTVNDAGAVDVWYNGVRQPLRGGASRVNRIIVGQAAR